MRHAPTPVSWAALVPWLAACACEPDERPAPRAPPPGLASGSVCDGAPEPGTASELLRALPRAVPGLCADPHGQVRVLGDGPDENLERACAPLFAEHCAVLEAHGIQRIARQRYINDAGHAESAWATVFQFASADGAYAYFTLELLAGEHPAELQVEALGAGERAALLGNRALIFGGNVVMELGFDSSRLTEQQASVVGTKLLSALSARVLAQLPDAADVPASVALLPASERIAFGVRHHRRDVFDIQGAGPGAIGYYLRGDRRYRVYANAAGDEGAARDIERTLRRAPGYHRLEEMTFDAFERSEAGPHGPSRWLIGRLGTRLLGVGDDLFGVPHNDLELREKKALSRLDKFRILRDVLLGTRK